MLFTNSCCFFYFWGTIQWRASILVCELGYEKWEELIEKQSVLVCVDPTSLEMFLFLLLKFLVNEQIMTASDAIKDVDLEPLLLSIFIVTYCWAPRKSPMDLLAVFGSHQLSYLSQLKRLEICKFHQGKISAVSDGM